MTRDLNVAVENVKMVRDSTRPELAELSFSPTRAYGEGRPDIFLSVDDSMEEYRFLAIMRLTCYAPTNAVKLFLFIAIRFVKSSKRHCYVTPSFIHAFISYS